MPLEKCQLCGKEQERELNFEDESSRPWAIHTIPLSKMLIQILACHDCDALNNDQIFEIYRERILRGEFECYH